MKTAALRISAAGCKAAHPGVRGRSRALHASLPASRALLAFRSAGRAQGLTGLAHSTALSPARRDSVPASACHGEIGCTRYASPAGRAARDLRSRDGLVLRGTVFGARRLVRAGAALIRARRARGAAVRAARGAAGRSRRGAARRRGGRCRPRRCCSPSRSGGRLTVGRALRRPRLLALGGRAGRFVLAVAAGAGGLSGAGRALVAVAVARLAVRSLALDGEGPRGRACAGLCLSRGGGRSPAASDDDLARRLRGRRARPCGSPPGGGSCRKSSRPVAP